MLICFFPFCFSQPYECTSCANQKNQHFVINNLEVIKPHKSNFNFLILEFTAELNTKVQDPYIEIQIGKGRIPSIRKKESLCRSGILNCPASFSKFSYSAMFPIQPQLDAGMYKIRLLFTEGNEKISCYEIKYYIDIRISPDKYLGEFF